MEMMDNIFQFLSGTGSGVLAIIWAIGILIFVVLEYMTLGLTHIWYAVGCILACIAACNNVSIFMQLLLFIGSSTLLVILSRPLAKRFVNAKVQKTNADRLIGQTAIVKETINESDETGLVRIGGMDWTARPEDHNEVIEKGKEVVIKEIQGVKLIVQAKVRKEK